MRVYWSPAKPRLIQRSLERFSIFFDPLSCGTHLLSEQHLAVLEQLGSERHSAISFSDLVKRVCSANGMEESEEVRETLQAVLNLLEKETLALSREAA